MHRFSVPTTGLRAATSWRWASRWCQATVLLLLPALHGCATSPSVQLYVAIKDGSYAGAKRVVDRNAPQLNMCDLLERSIGAGRADFVSAALRDGASPNCTGANEFTVLYSAVALQCPDCAKALIIGGARINDSGRLLQQTPLDTAYVNGDRDLIRFMSSRGAVRKLSDAQVAQIQANLRKAAAAADDDEPTTSTRVGGVPDASYAATGIDSTNPACATGQRELREARTGCANGNTASCTRVSQLTSALGRLGCAAPVVDPSRAGLSNNAGSSPVGKQPVTCLRQQRNQTGGIDLYNGCGFTVGYSFCIQGAAPGSALGCDASLDGKGTDFLAAGRTAANFRGTNVLFVACEGGAASGNLPRLERGSGSCR